MAGGLVTIAQYRDLPEAGLAKSQLYFVALRGRGAKGTVVTLLSYREKKVNQVTSVPLAIQEDSFLVGV